MISARLNLVAVLGSILLLLVILELIRRKYLRERYALIWIVTGSLFLLVSAWVEILSWISNLLGFSVPSNALLLFGVLFLISISLGLSVITSRLSEKNRTLTQELTLLKKRLDDLEKTRDEAKLPS